MLKLRSKARDPKRRRRSSRPRDFEAPSRFEQFLGWCVHGYTALGLVAAAMIAALVVRGGPESFGWAFLLMALATIVDSTDGTLAQRVRIQEVVPGFDGRRLDDIIDFLNYTFLPILLIWRAELLPPGHEFWLLLPLLASIYGFCQVKVKTDDGYFLGFPSLWNVVAFYLYVLPLGSWASLAVIVVLAVFTFVPSKYLYPSQPGRLNQAATVLGVVWAVPLGWLIWRVLTSTTPRHDPSIQRLAVATLFYPVFYLAVSWIVTLNHWTRPTREQ
ncbi:MAG TPA: CDP-alcohol phosphatidyltransferase family protein [Isosphaeraceae bacterium]|nr:CDP-alcohol phosphatidyltransferase family protein [Isosphaeraceae bacterium]